MSVAYTFEIYGVAQIIPEHQIGETDRCAVLAPLDAAPQDERDVCGAMVCAHIRVLRHPSAKLAVHEDGDLILLADALHLLEEAPDGVGAVLHLAIVWAFLIDVRVK